LNFFPPFKFNFQRKILENKSRKRKKDWELTCGWLMATFEKNF
jgi:hypothetical protein